MRSAFSLVFNMSVTASILILIILFVKLFFKVWFKKLPKGFVYVLWSVVLFRLLCPFSISLPISPLTPLSPTVSKPVDSSFFTTIEYVNMMSETMFEGAAERKSPAREETYAAANHADLQGGSVSKWLVIKGRIDEMIDSMKQISTGEYAYYACSAVWLFGAFYLLGITLSRVFKLKKKLVFACRLKSNIYESDAITTAFILGIIRPKIFIPMGIPDYVRNTVVLHEQTHQERGDNLVKAVAIIALAIYWFNPLVWLAYKLACDDMEMSCDEIVLRKLYDLKKSLYSAKLDYGYMLVGVAARRWNYLAPAAFANNETKYRIKNIAQYKMQNRKTWVRVALGCIAFIVVSISNPTVPSAVPETISANAPVIGGYRFDVIDDGLMVHSTSYESYTYYDDGSFANADYYDDYDFWHYEGFGEVPDGGFNLVDAIPTESSENNSRKDDPNPIGKLTVQADLLYVRSGVGKGNNVIACLRYGDKVSYVAVSADENGDKWYQIMLNGDEYIFSSTLSVGSLGWISGTYVVVDESAVTTCATTSQTYTSTASATSTSAHTTASTSATTMATTTETTANTTAAAATTVPTTAATAEPTSETEASNEDGRKNDEIVGD